MPIQEVMRSAANRRSVEALLEQLERLTRERQELRAGSVSSARLEENRLAIVDAQWELSHALIDRYLPVSKAA